MSITTRNYTDLDLNFEAHPVTGDIVKKKDISAVIGSVYNILQTAFYERPFRPHMGGNLKKILFEPVDSLTANILRDEISLAINQYEPRVKLEGILVVPDEDNHKYNVTLTFFITNNPNPITINLFMERVR